MIAHLREKAIPWFEDFFSTCAELKSFPAVYRTSKILDLVKPGEKTGITGRSSGLISLLCDLFKLYERILLNRLSSIFELQLIQEQAGFRAGNSTTSQLLKLAQFIKDDFEKNEIAGAAFIDLIAANETANHRKLSDKLFAPTGDYKLTRNIKNVFAY